MNFPLMIDRLGSAFFALVSSLTITGMIALGFQSMPVSTAFLGFDRYEELSKADSGKTLFPSGDSLVLAMVKGVSNNCFAGEKSFAQHHPDMLRELYLNRLVPEGYEGSRQEASESINSVRVSAVEASQR